MSISLSERLIMIAKMVPKCKVAADIGTDHGYLPVWLLENGICESAIAADINEGPLAKARQSAQDANLNEKIQFRLCDGLSGIESSEIDVIIIAGMGGETIEGILNCAPWAKNKTMLLQPQSKIPELRLWIHNNGLCVSDAKLVYDASRFYVVWKVHSGKEDDILPENLYVDRLLMTNKDPHLPSYLRHIIAKNEGIIRSLEKSERTADEVSEIKALNEKFSEMLGECERWQK